MVCIVGELGVGSETDNLSRRHRTQQVSRRCLMYVLLVCSDAIEMRS